MIFLNGNNNLDLYGQENIKAMERVGSNDDVNIIVQWASFKARKAVRLYVTKSNNTHRITSRVVEDLGGVDMGNPKALEDFIQWTVEHYPAEHYFIDVWDHGHGWHQSQKTPSLTKDISVDEVTGNSISTEQLGRVMARAALLIGHKVDIYGSDACLMGMAEVANEMSDYVDYFVGSQETEPVNGWPYAQLLKKWEAIPNITAPEIIKILTQEYVKAYQPGGVYHPDKVTFSGYDLSKLPALNRALQNLGVSIRALNQNSRSLLLARAKQVRKFDYKDYGDLIDFMTALSTASQQALNQQVVDDVVTAAKSMIIANKTTADYTHAHGLSIWLPSSNYLYKKRAAKYKNLRFTMNTQWDQTLESLLDSRYRIS